MIIDELRSRSVIRHSALCPLPSALSGFTLIEMATTLAVLIILLGMMVSLARHVRDQSAQQLTRDLLHRLDTLMAQYVEHNDGKWPAVRPLIAADVNEPPKPPVLAEAALKNNEQWIRFIEQDLQRRSPSSADEPHPGPFGDEPISIYDSKTQTLRDAWGSPVVFMARQHPLIGLAPSRSGRDQFFFFSAGPDRNYLTREDNLYSYETAQ